MQIEPQTDRGDCRTTIFLRLLIFKLAFDVLEPFTAGMCDGEWCGLLQGERMDRWTDICLS